MKIMKHYILLFVSLLPMIARSAPVETATKNGRLQLCYNVMFTGAIHTDGCSDEHFNGIFDVGDTVSLDLSSISAFIGSLYDKSEYMILDYDMFRYGFDQCFEYECTKHDYEESVDKFECMTDWFDNAVMLTIGDRCIVEVRYCIVKGFFFFTPSAGLDNHMYGLCCYIPENYISKHAEICVPLAPVSYFKCGYNPFITSNEQSNKIKYIHRKPEILKQYETSHTEM